MKCSSFEPTHAQSARPLARYLKDKIVFDIGCGDGKFAEAMGDYAKQVIGIEIDPILAYKAHSRGLEVVEADFEVLEPLCDVVYAFLSFVGNYKLYRWLKMHDWHGTVISHYYPLVEDPTKPLKPNKIIHGELPWLIYKL